MSALELLAKRQASWSITANELKSRLDRVRWIVFAFSVIGALLATIASQLPPDSADDHSRRWVATVGAIVLGLATFLTARLMGSVHVGAWVRARAAAEALKREGFKFAARAAPYDAAGSEKALATEQSKIEEGVDDLTDRLVQAQKPGSMPTAAITADEYVAKRIRGQIDNFYVPKADAFRRSASRLRAIEFTLALIATIVTAVFGVLEKYPVSNFPFDLAALTAILTTVGALILSHIEASRYDFLVTTYRATARRLEDALADVGTAMPSVPSEDWSRFVEQCESIISAENNSWVAKHTR